MNKEHNAIKNPENVCFKCLKETKVHKIHIPALGWGSEFDNFSTRINLCNDCYELTNPDWWKLEIIKGETDWDGSYYKYEEEIYKFVKSMSIEGRELFYARYSYGAHAENMQGQDWIDYELGILPHEKCKEYGCYSHQEIEAYKIKFPKCQHPVNRIYNDGSKGCWCPFGAHGNYGQECGLSTSVECYKCGHFTERTTPIRDVYCEDYRDYVIWYISKINEDKYRNKFS